MKKRYFVGGRIYYINAEDNGVKYHFYDVNGNEMTDIKVGDKPYKYSVEGKPRKDKYYVFCEEPVGYWQWSTYLNLLGGTAENIGAGRENTNLIASCFSDSLSLKTCITLMNRAKVNNCTDWFIPSKEELNELACSGLVNDIFGKELVWSSSEHSAHFAWSWYPNSH